MMPDLINGCFELGGGFFTLLHIRKLMADKEVKGIHPVPVVFFLSWGIWNLYYYSHLQQWVSLVGGVWLVITNAWWVVLLLYYWRYPKGTCG